MNSIPLSDIEDGPNVRTVAPPPLLEEALQTSISANGVLTPILVRFVPIDGIVRSETAPIPVNSNRPRYQVVLGSRRVRAARAAGMTEIPAEVREMTNAEVRMAQMGDHTLRRSLHAVDQWRAVRAIVETDGFTPGLAARALGLEEGMVRRMDRIGRLPPTLLSLCEIELPPDRILLKLLRADPKSAVGATKSLKGLVRTAPDGKSTVDWQAIADRVQPATRASSLHAIFDVDAANLTWDEDFFAEPGSAEHITTLQVAAFRNAQREALRAKYQRARKHEVVEPGESGTEPVLPTGYRQSYIGSPDKPGLHEKTFWCVATTGEIKGIVATDLAAQREAEKAARKADKAKPAAQAPAAIDDDDRDNDGITAGAGDDSDPGESDDGEPVEEKVAAATGVTKAGMVMIHKAKTEALRQALRDQEIDPHDLLLFLVLAIGADNVTVNGTDAKRGDIKALARPFITREGGSATPADDVVCKAAREALARMLRIGVSQSWYDMASGPAAEWIGTMVRAGDYLARFDTADFLAQCRGPELRQAAAAGGVKWAGSVTAMRDRLVGQSETWRPTAAVFGAAGPAPGHDDA